MIWMLLTLSYGIFKGFREISKKLAMQKHSVMEVLVAYTVISFVFVIPQASEAGGMELKYYGFIAVKSFSIFLAWICSFVSLKKLPVSVYGILDLSRVLFATFFGVAFLGEALGLFQIQGLCIVSSGLLLLRFKPHFLKKLFRFQDASEKNTSSGEKIPSLYVIMALISCLLNAVSAFLDKVLMKNLTSSQLQYWYMFFLVIYYLIYMVATKQEMSRSVWSNGWIWFMAFIFVVGDKALFIANADPQSQIVMMTLIKQSACLITILGGKYVFKEKNIAYKLFCAAIIIGGIVLGVLGKR